MTHQHGVDAEPIHAFAWDVFRATTSVAKELGLYGAGQDILSDAFSGNLRGMGPGYAELEFEPRPSETVLCFLADKTLTTLHATYVGLTPLDHALRVGQEDLARALSCSRSALCRHFQHIRVTWAQVKAGRA